MFAAVSFAVAPSLLAGELPTGHSFSQGSGSVTTSGSNMSVALNGASVINWSTYNVGQGSSVSYTGGDSVNFVQTGATSIDGLLTSDSKLFLVNPNGILVGSTGVVSAADFAAIANDGVDANALLGGALAVSGSGAVVGNAGSIDAGLVALIGSDVSNSGAISGEEVVLGGATGALYIDTTTGDWDAAGAGSAINTGSISASGASVDGGRVYLVTSRSEGAVSNTGSIEVDGGFVETSGANFGLDVAPTTNGGKWLIDPTEITITEGKTSYTSSLIHDDALAAALTGSGIVEVLSSTGSIDVTSSASISPIGSATLKLNSAENITYAGKINKKGDNILNVQLLAVGDVSLSGNAKIDTGTAGNITIDGTNITASTSTANIQFDSRGGAIDVTATGDLTLTAGAGYQLQFKSRGGNQSWTGANVDINIADKAVTFDTKSTSGNGGSLLVEATSGDITIDTAANGQFKVQTAGASGFVGGGVTFAASNDIIATIADKQFLMQTGSGSTLVGGNIDFAAGGSILLNPTGGVAKVNFDSRGGDINLIAASDPLATQSGTALSDLNNSISDNASNDVLLNGKIRSRDGNINIVAQGNFVVGGAAATAVAGKATAGTYDGYDVRSDGGRLSITAISDIIVDGAGKIRAGVGSTAAGNSVLLRADNITLVDVDVDSRGGIVVLNATNGLGDTEDGNVQLLRHDKGGARLRSGGGSGEDIGGVLVSADNDVVLNGANGVIDGRGDVNIAAGGNVVLYKKIKAQIGTDNPATPDVQEARGDINITAGAAFLELRDGTADVNGRGGNDDTEAKGRGELATEDGNITVIADTIVMNSKTNGATTNAKNVGDSGDINLTATNDIFIMSTVAGKKVGADVNVTSTAGSVYIGGDAVPVSVNGYTIDESNQVFNARLLTSTKSGEAGGAITVTADQNVIMSGGSHTAKKNKVVVRSGGTNGDLTVTASNGDVRMEGATGLNATSEGNGVALRSAAGTTILAPNGDITLKASDSAVNADGEVRSDGTSLVMTAGGDIIVDALGANKGDVAIGIQADGANSATATFTAGGDILFTNGATGGRSFLGRAGKWGTKDGGAIVTNVIVQADGDVQLAQDVTVSQKGSGSLTITADSDVNNVGAFITNLADIKTNGTDKAVSKSIYLRTGTGDIDVTASAVSSRATLSDGSTGGDLGSVAFVSAFGSNNYSAETFTNANSVGTKIPDTVASLGLRSDGGAVSIAGLHHVLIHENSRVQDNDVSISTAGSIAFKANFDEKGTNAAGTVSKSFTAGEDILFFDKAQVRSFGSGLPVTNMTFTAAGDIDNEFDDQKNMIRITSGDLALSAGGVLSTPRIELGSGNLSVTASGDVLLQRQAITGGATITSSAGGISQNERLIVSGNTVLSAANDITLYDNLALVDWAKSRNELAGVQVLAAQNVTLASKTGIDLIGIGGGQNIAGTANVLSKGEVTDSNGGWQVGTVGGSGITGTPNSTTLSNF